MAVYTLFGQPAAPASLAGDTTAYTFGVQFSVSQSGCTLTGLWWYSPPGAQSLPGTIALYQVSGASLVHSEAASWSGAQASGWVRAAFSSPPALTPSTSYVAVIFDGVTHGSWYSATAHYWDTTGAGAGGITNGVLSAPNNAGSANGQGTFDSSGSLAFPLNTFNATNYWLDPEVTGTAAATPSPRCLAASGALVQRRRRRARGLWRGMAVQAVSTSPSFTIGLLTAYDAPGTAVLGLLDETGIPVLDEAGSSILSEDGS